MSHQVRQQPRRDENEAPIVEALEAAGCIVKKTSTKGMPDLVILVPGRPGRASYVAMVEVKGEKAKLRPEQAKFFELVRGKELPIFVVRSAAEALAVIGVGKAEGET